MIGWEDSKRWSDRFLVEIKRTLGEFLLQEPSLSEDQEHNTDLIVLNMKSVRIACRIRRYSYYGKFRKEFTIRCFRSSGMLTELEKIMQGWGDYFFYGFSAPDEKSLIGWTILKLDSFRSYVSAFMAQNDNRYPGQEVANEDESSNFRIFRLDELPPLAIVAQKLPTPSLTVFVSSAPVATPSSPTPSVQAQTQSPRFLEITARLKALQVSRQQG